MTLLAGVAAVSLVVVPVFDAFVIWQNVEDRTFQAFFMIFFLLYRSVCTCFNGSLTRQLVI